MKIRVLLWDIDGTLIRSGGAGERAWLRALRDLFGIDAGMHGIAWAGRTDPYISRLFFEKYDLPGDDEAIHEFLRRYVEFLPEELSCAEGTVLPGVQALLHAVDEREDLHQALLTGNVIRGAEIKLTHYGLWDFFSSGGFADGIYDRPAIAQRALEAVREQWDPQLEASEVLVLGDTPFDIECGRSIGARTLGVATGYSKREELKQSQPDFFYEDLSDGAEILRQIGID